jgi:hypothetical protein
MRRYRNCVGFLKIGFGKKVENEVAELSSAQKGICCKFVSGTISIFPAKDHWLDGANDECNVLNRLDQRNGFCPSMPPSTTPSTPNAI